MSHVVLPHRAAFGRRYAGAPKPAPGQTQAEANQLRDAKRVSHAKGRTFVGVKGHKHSRNVLKKMSRAIRRWHAANKEANKERALRAGATNRARAIAEQELREKRRRDRLAQQLAAERVAPKVETSVYRAQTERKQRQAREERERNRELLRLLARVLHR